MCLSQIAGSLRSRQKLRQMRNSRVVRRQFCHFLMRMLFALLLLTFFYCYSTELQDASCTIELPREITFHHYMQLDYATT